MKRSLVALMVVLLVLALPCLLLAASTLSADAGEDADGDVPAETPTVPGLIESQDVSFPQPLLTVPEAPAFTLLGLTPNEVSNPNTPSELSTSVLKGFDRNGNLQAGVALNVVPYLVFASPTLYEYRQNLMTGILSRTLVSFATTEGDSDADKAVRVGLGVNVTIFDRGDYRADKALDRSFEEAIDSTPGIDEFIPSGISEEERKLLVAEIDRKKRDRARTIEERFAPARDEARARNWNGSAWVIGAGKAWISPNAKLDLSGSGSGIWSTLAYGFEGVTGLEDTAQLLLHWRVRNDDRVPDPDSNGQYLIQDTRAWGPSVRLGSRNVHGNIEYLIAKSTPRGATSLDYHQVGIGIEWKVGEGRWLQLAYSTRSGDAISDNDSSAGVNFSWGFAKEPGIVMNSLSAR